MALTLPLACAVWAACVPGGVPSDGVVTTETRPISSFTALELNGAFDVTLSAGQEPSLTLTTDRNLLPHITRAGQRALVRQTERWRRLAGLVDKLLLDES